jgi:hypothetical protein
MEWKTVTALIKAAEDNDSKALSKAIASFNKVHAPRAVPFLCLTLGLELTVSYLSCCCV